MERPVTEVTANKGTIFSRVNTAERHTTSSGISTERIRANCRTCGSDPSPTDGNFYGTTAGGRNIELRPRCSASTPKTARAQRPCTTSRARKQLRCSFPSRPRTRFFTAVLYGTTQSGEVYTFNLKTQTFQPLPYKTPGDPNASLVQASDGYLYGVSQVGGKDNAGTIFPRESGGKGLKILYAFTAGTDGASPTGPLVEGKGGLFGTTYYAGSSTHDAGVVFMLALSSLQFTTLHIFVGTDGSRPAAGLKAATDGSFYGTTAYGGANGVGTIFQITPSGTFTISSIYGMGGSVSGNGPGPRSWRNQRHSLWGSQPTRRQRDGRGRRRLLQPYPSRHYS